MNVPAEHVTSISICIASSVRRISRTSSCEIVTSREASSKTSPALTRSCARLPSTLTADTELGRCEITPRIEDKSRWISASVIASKSLLLACESTSPSTSSVMVAVPRAIVAR